MEEDELNLFSKKELFKMAHDAKGNISRLRYIIKIMSIGLEWWGHIGKIVGLM